MKYTWLSIFIALLLVSHSVLAKPTFEKYLTDLKLQAIEQGYPVDFVEQVFAGVSYREKTIKADKNQAETKITLDKYLATRVPDWKVKQALDLMHEHQELLERVEHNLVCKNVS